MDEEIRQFFFIPTSVERVGREREGRREGGKIRSGREIAVRDAVPPKASQVHTSQRLLFAAGVGL